MPVSPPPVQTPAHLLLYKWQRSTLLCLILAYGGYYFCRTNLVVALPTLLTATGLNKAEFGHVISAGYACYAGGKLVSGLSIDVVGGKRVLIACLLGSVMCTLWFASVSDDRASISLFTVIWGANRIFQSGGWPALTTIVRAWFPSNRHGQVMGIAALSYSFGDAVIRLFLGKLIGNGMTWQNLFTVSALFALLLLLPSMAMLRNSPQEASVVGPTDAAASSEALSLRSVSPTRPSRSHAQTSRSQRGRRARSANSRERGQQVSLLPMHTQQQQQQQPSALSDSDERSPEETHEGINTSATTTTGRSSNTPTRLTGKHSSPRRSISPIHVVTARDQSRQPRMRSSSPHTPPSPASPVATAYAPPAHTVKRPSPMTVLKLFGPLLRQPKYYLLILQSPIFTWTREVFNTWVVMYLYETFKMTQGNASVVSLVFPLLGTVSTLGGGFLIDYIPRRRKFLLHLILVVLTTFTLSLFARVSVHQPSPVKVPNAPHPADGALDSHSDMFWAVCLIGLCALFSTAPTSFVDGVFAMEVAGRDNPGLAIGTIHCAGYIGAIASGHYVGHVVETSGWGHLFAMMCAASAVNTILSAALWYVDIRQLAAMHTRPQYEPLS
ncbi:hypothetical protein RI367_005692 [Sorochytrium milnesiophthora]